MSAPSVFDTREVLEKYILKCIQKKHPTATISDIRTIWDNAEKKKSLIIDALTQLYEEHKAKGDRFRSIAYGRALTQIKKMTSPIVSGKQAKKIKGIGKGIADKIDEILRTGKLAILEKEADMDADRVAVVNKFMSIWSVGSVLANVWYDKGYRHIRDIPSNVLSDAQRIYIKYYDELQEKIPREEIEYMFGRVKDVLKNVVTVSSIELVGSYRRGLLESRDIDVLITDTHSSLTSGPGNTIVKALEENGIITDTLSSGPQRFLGIVRSPRTGKHHRFDIFLVPREDRGTALAHFTGPADFVIDMKNRAMKKGYRFTEKGMFDENDMKISLPREQDVFKILDMEYVEPENRK